MAKGQGSDGGVEPEVVDEGVDEGLGVDEVQEAVRDLSRGHLDIEVVKPGRLFLNGLEVGSIDEKSLVIRGAEMSDVPLEVTVTFRPRAIRFSS